MNVKPDTIIELARRRGLKLEVEGGLILYRGPGGSMTAELKQAIANHKAEIIEYLQKEQMAFMTLNDFSKSNMAVKIFSEVLGREVYFCSNEQMRDAIRHTGLSAYLPNELKCLIRSSPDKDSLQVIDDAKEVFPSGAIIQ